MRRLFLTVIACVLSHAGIYAADFQKSVYFDPYFYLLLSNADTSGMNLPSYFAQLDSMGVTLTVGRGDYIATSNPYGVKIAGQYGMRSFFNWPLDM